MPPATARRVAPLARGSQSPAFTELRGPPAAAAAGLLARGSQSTAFTEGYGPPATWDWAEPGTRPPEHSVHVAVTARPEDSARGPGGCRAGPGGERGSRSVSRVLSAARSPRGVTVISLRPRSPAASSSLPGDRRAASSPPTWPCSGRGLPGRTVASPPVGSYPTVAPWPPRMRDGGLFLWHSPWGRPRWALPSALPFGARTFLGANRAATVRPAPGAYGSIAAAPGKGAACDVLRRHAPRAASPHLRPCTTPQPLGCPVIVVRARRSLHLRPYAAPQPGRSSAPSRCNPKVYTRRASAPQPDQSSAPALTAHLRTPASCSNRRRGHRPSPSARAPRPRGAGGAPWAGRRPRAGARPRVRPPAAAPW